MIRVRHVALILIWAAALSSNGCDGASASSTPELQLSQVFVDTIPDSVRIGGVRQKASGGRVTWYRGSSYVDLDFRGRSTIGIPGETDSIVAAALLDEDSLVSIVTSRKGIWLLTTRGRRVDHRALDPTRRVQTAIRKDGAWILGAANAGGEFELIRAADDGRTVNLLTLRPGQEGRDGAPVSAHLAEMTGDVLVTLLRRPFSITRVAENGRILRVHAPGGHAELKSLLDRRDSTRDWVSLRTVVLDSAFLQTLADLRSSDRVLAVYARDDRPVRVTRLSAALGFLESVPSQQLLLASRNTGVEELVGYRWRWGIHLDSRETP